MKTRTSFKNSRKGQISFVEYIISITVFIAFVAYFAIQLLTFVPLYLSQVRSEEARSEAYQISDVLINDPGYPINWESNLNNIQRLGLNDETQNLTNMVSTSKLNSFFALCQGKYFNVLNWLGSGHQFYLTASEINSTDGSVDAILTCQPPSIPFGNGPVNTSITRFAVINNSFYVQMIVQVV